MPLKDWLAALLVIVIWGVNFVVIKVGLNDVPPLLLGGLRFSLVAFPAVFFVKRPAVGWGALMLYAFTISFAQFIFLFVAIYIGMPAGLSSLVMQSQAFFTVLIAAMFLNEKVRRHNIIGIAVAVLGLVLIGWGARPGSVPILGFALTLCSAICWAVGNIIIKGFGKVDMFALVVWGALIPPIPFFALSWLVEGPAQIQHALVNISVLGIGAVFYLAFISTNIGFALWGRLLSKHPVSKIAPLSLLIPVIGLVSSWLMLDEHMTLLQWVSGVIVVAGLAMNSFGMKLLPRLAHR